MEKKGKPIVKKERCYVILYFSQGSKFDILGDERTGKLIRAGIKYGETDEEPDFSYDPLLNYAWIEFKTDIDISIKQYELEKARGQKGGLVKASKDRLGINDTVKNLVKNEFSMKPDLNLNDYLIGFEEELKKNGSFDSFTDKGNVQKATELTNYINKCMRMA